MLQSPVSRCINKLCIGVDGHINLVLLKKDWRKRNFVPGYRTFSFVLFIWNHLFHLVYVVYLTSDSSKIKMK